METVVEGLQEQPESGATQEERPTRIMDERKACGFEVDSNLLEGIRGSELSGTDAVDNAER